jgi:hypothetical protein
MIARSAAPNAAGPICGAPSRVTMTGEIIAYATSSRSCAMRARTGTHAPALGSKREKQSASNSARGCKFVMDRAAVHAVEQRSRRGTHAVENLCGLCQFLGSASRTSKKSPGRARFEASADPAMKRMTHAAAGARSESSLVPLAMFFSDWREALSRPQGVHWRCRARRARTGAVAPAGRAMDESSGGNRWSQIAQLASRFQVTRQCPAGRVIVRGSRDVLEALRTRLALKICGRHVA